MFFNIIMFVFVSGLVLLSIWSLFRIRSYIDMLDLKTTNKFRRLLYKIEVQDETINALTCKIMAFEILQKSEPKEKKFKTGIALLKENGSNELPSPPPAKDATTKKKGI